MSDADVSEQDWRERAEAAEKHLGEALQAAEQRLIRSELKAEALRAGMVDLDGLKLMDTAELVLNEKGELPGVAHVMATLKRTKPWLFGDLSSSSGVRPPAAQQPQHRLATEMSHDEWRSARADLLRRR